MLVNQLFLATTESPSGSLDWAPFELFEQGGIFMWPLLILSFASAFICFFSFWTTRQSAVLPTNMVGAVEVYIRKKDYGGLLAACSYDRSCFARTVHVVIMFLQRNPRANIDEVREVAIAEGSRQSMKLTRQITWLSDIASIAPMLGLLGTVVGMMNTFFEMGQGHFQGVQQMSLSGGIAQAMITTAGGLILAIPSLAVYYFFRSRIQKSITDMEVATTHVLSIISVQMDREQRLGKLQTRGQVAHYDAPDEV